MNIIKDPTKSIHTRKIDRVGETSAITSAVDESGDRFCEAINYYARGQNPMVSVSYGQSQTLRSGLDGSNNATQAFLPYRIAREGAFRPPIWSQEDLLPLSRLPRIWTQASTQPYQPIFTMRLRNCGTAEETREVKNNALKIACETSKVVAAYPDINHPDIRPNLIKDPLVPGEITSAVCNNQNNVQFDQYQSRGPILLAPTRDSTSGYTNPRAIRESPIVLNNVQLAPTRDSTSGYTNPRAIRESPIVYNNVQLAPTRNATSGYTNLRSIKESPIVYNNVQLYNNRPNGTMMTNYAAPSLSGYNPNSESNFTRLPSRASRGGFDANPSVPGIEMNHPTKTLLRIR
jgi:hypothetical protein